MKKTDHPVAEQHHQTFEGIRQLDAEGNEYWTARQLARVLEYSEYRHFLPGFAGPLHDCRNSGHAETNHFEDVLEMVSIGSRAKRQIADIHLRQTIADLGGTMPEALPTPEASIQQLERGKRKLEAKP